ncbi:hypothetical protein HMPREF3224_02051 [Anaerococcus hydrogenalis]|nr:hypothetical protein HMPREF3224_02051 [Anaerococcus hydrogenalis]
MDNLIKIYMNMLAQANHDIALLKAENGELYREIEKIKKENKEKNIEEFKETKLCTN